jgi:hypothetical protein
MRTRAIRFAIAMLLVAAATVSWLALCHRLPAPALSPIGNGIRSVSVAPSDREAPASAFEAGMSVARARTCAI